MEYISGFFSQLFYFNWLGSVIILLTGAGILYLAYKLSARIFFTEKLNVLHFFPLILMLGLFKGYNFPYSAALVVLFIYYICWLFLILSENGANKYLSFTLLAVTGYYIAGSGFFMVFALSTILLLVYLQGIKRTALLSLYIVTFSAIIPYLGYKYIFNFSLKTAYLSFIPDLPGILEYKPVLIFHLFAFSLPGLILIASALAGLKNYFSDSRQESESADTISRDGISDNETELIAVKKKSKAGFYLNLVMIAVLAFYILHKAGNPSLKNAILVDYYTYNEEWNKAVETALSEKYYSVFINFNYNRAISNLDQLSTRFFHYPQRFGADILNPGKVTGSDFAMISSDYYYDLGFISEALHWAHEAQSLQMYSPRILKRMVMANLILYNYRAAEKYLNILDKNFLSREFVKEFRPLVQDTLKIQNDSEIMTKRSFHPSHCIASGISENCKNLLIKNSENKIAFEHLQIYLMMDHNLDAFLNYINKGRKFYREMPLHYEEALIVYLMEKDRRKLENLKTSYQSKQYLKDYMNLMQKFNNNPQAARNLMYKQIGNSYLYYLTYYFPEVQRNQHPK